MNQSINQKKGKRETNQVKKMHRKKLNKEEEEEEVLNEILKKLRDFQKTLIPPYWFQVLFYFVSMGVFSLISQKMAWVT